MRERRLLWFGAVGGAAAWLVQLVGFGLLRQSCEGGRAGEVAGLDPTLVAWVLAVAAGLVAALALAAAIHAYLTTARTTGGTWLFGAAALFFAASFLIAVVVSGAGLVLLDPCG
jgi:hypothetical protein